MVVCQSMTPSDCVPLIYSVNKSEIILGTTEAERAEPIFKDEESKVSPLLHYFATVGMTRGALLNTVKTEKQGYPWGLVEIEMLTHNEIE